MNENLKIGKRRNIILISCECIENIVYIIIYDRIFSNLGLCGIEVYNS